MEREVVFVTRRRVLAVVCFGLSILASPCLAQQAAIAVGPPNPRDPDRWAFHHLCDVAGDHCTPATIDKFGYSLIQYPRPLRAGDRVQIYGSDRAGEPFRCDHLCSLYFLDLKPGAHFAHPTAVGLYDWETGELWGEAGEWWPVVNGSRHVFDTVRTRVKYSIDEQAGEFGLPTVRKRKKPSVLRPDIQISTPDLTFGRSDLAAGPPCGVYGLIINAYNDENDSFDEDTDGIYAVLRGQGVPDDQIVFVSPFDSPWRDYSTSRDNIEAAIKEMASKIEEDDRCTEFVFLISTHGKENKLEVRPRRGQHYFLPDTTFGPWLGQITGCPTWTVVVEACKSQSVEDEISKAANDAGAVHVRHLYSAGHGRTSWGDVDENDSNPEDLGSETTWGYIEAFGTSAADTPDSDVAANRSVSFCEAVIYAKRHDATRPADTLVEDECDNTKVNDDWAAVAELGQAGDAAAHACCSFEDLPEVGIDPDCVQTKRRRNIEPHGMSRVVKRCTNARVKVTVQNQGATAMPVGTLRLFGRVLNEDGSPSTEREPYTNLVLVSGLEPDEERTFELRWGVLPVFEKKDRVELFATFDSPQAPVWAAPGPGDTPPPGPWQTNQQACQCEVSVIKRCFPIIGCKCRDYVHPEVKLEAIPN